MCVCKTISTYEITSKLRVCLAHLQLAKEEQEREFSRFAVELDRSNIKYRYLSHPDLNYWIS